MYKRFMSLVVLCIFIFATCLMNADNALSKSKKILLNKKKLTLNVNKTFKLKLKGSISKNTKWFSSNKIIATVNKSGKVTAKKTGKCSITAKYMKKKYVCNVNVKAPITAIDEGISLLLKNYDVENKTIEIAVYNGTNTDISVGCGSFSLYKSVNSTWQNVSMLSTAPAVSSTLSCLNSKTEWTEKISLEVNYGNLEAGEYMLYKTINETLYNVSFIIPKSTETSSLANLDTITLSVSKNAENKLIISMNNNSDNDVYMGYSHYTLSKIVNGTQESIPRIENGPQVQDISLCIKPGKSLSDQYSVSDYFGTLSPGQYRLTKEIPFHDIYVDFSI